MIHVARGRGDRGGLATTVLITNGESGKSGVGRGGWPMGGGASLQAQFEQWTGPMGAPTSFTMAVMRYLKQYNVTQEQLAMVAVVQREYAAMNPNAMMKDPITVEDVLNSRMIAYPFRLFMCCLVTDGAGALILTSADRAKDFRLSLCTTRTGESSRPRGVADERHDFSRAFKRGQMPSAGWHLTRDVET